MAESLAAQWANNRSNQANEKDGAHRKLQLMTFGDATLAVLNVQVTKANQTIDLVKRAGGRKYGIKTDGNGMVVIEYEKNDAFAVALFNNSQWVTNLYIDEKGLNIGNVSRAQAMQVATLHVTKNEPRNVYTTFEVENKSEALMKRLDIKGHATSWFSVFSHKADMLMVRPNGNWLAEKLLYFTDQLTTQAINNYRRSNGQKVLPSDSTVVMQRRHAKTEKANEREKELQEIERLHEGRERTLDENLQAVREETARHIRELEELALLEARLTRLYAEEEFDQVRKRIVAQGMVEVGRDDSELPARKKQLQEEKEKFNQELKEFEALKSKKEAEKQAQVATGDQQTQTEPALWNSHQNVMQTMSVRFTNMRRTIFRNGRVTVVMKPAE